MVLLHNHLFVLSHTVPSQLHCVFIKSKLHLHLIFCVVSDLVSEAEIIIAFLKTLEQLDLSASLSKLGFGQKAPSTFAV